MTRGSQEALPNKPKQPTFDTGLSPSRPDIKKRSDNIRPEPSVTIDGNLKGPIRLNFPLANGSTGGTTKPGDHPVKVTGQSRPSSISRVDPEAVATRSTLHREGVLSKSRQLYRRYLEHHNKEDRDEARREHRQPMQLYNHYLERLEKEGNEALGRHGTQASGPSPVPATPAPSEGARREEGAKDGFLEGIPVEQVVAKVPDSSQGSKGYPLSPTYAPTYSIYASTSPTHAPTSPAHGHLPVLTLLAPSEGARLEGGVREVVVEDAPMEQAAAEGPETSQGSKSRSSSPTGPGYVPFVPQSHLSSPIYSRPMLRPPRPTLPPTFRPLPAAALPAQVTLLPMGIQSLQGG